MEHTMMRKTLVAVTVLLSMNLEATGLALWLAGAIWSTFVWIVIVAIPTLLVIKLIRKIGKAA